MNLLEKATTITTATGYDNGKLHSVKGGSVADFDVVRGSLATRVNAEGLIEDISTLSGELVTNGDFSNGAADWALGTGWSIADGKATATSSPSGQSVSQNSVASSLSSGSLVQVSFQVLDITQGSFGIYFGGTLVGSINSVGTFNGTFIKGTETSFYIRALGTTSGSIDNISVIEVIDATNIPRIDYTDGTPSLLLEPQSTNLITYSEDFINAAWGEISSPTLISGELAPNGTLSATKISGTIGSSYIALPQGSSATATRSIYAKTVSGTGTARLMSYHANTNNLFTLTEEWQRFELTGTTTTAGNTSFYIDFRDNTQTLSEFIIWGAQSEELTYATSYIPTSGAIATRLADSVTGAGDATTFNSTEGVLYAEMAALANDGAYRSVSLSNGTNANRVNLTYSTASNILLGFINVNGVNTSFTFTVNPVTDFVKCALKYKNNDCSLWVNGVEVSSSTSQIAFPINTLTKLSFTSGGSSSPFFGKVKSVITFDTALTDAELQCLTTI